MKNGLYSFHIHMLDGVRGRDSGILVLKDGKLMGGGPYFWSVGSYSVGNGTWKGQLITNQHTPLADPFARSVSGGQEVIAGFPGHLPMTGRGVRHHFGGHPEPEFSRDIEEADGR